MKRLMLLPALTLLVACGETPTEPPTFELPPPSASFANGPAAVGVVMRGEEEIGVTWVDEAKGWRVVLGTDMLDYCAGTPDFDVVAVQTLLLEGNTMRLVKGEDLRTSVWPFPEFDCALFTTVDPLATGYSHLINTDNDWNAEGPRANAWGFRASGTLTDQYGAPVDFSAHIQFRYNAHQGLKTNSTIDLVYP